jgi:hypothetical protein
MHAHPYFTGAQFTVRKIHAPQPVDAIAGKNLVSPHRFPPFIKV